MKDIFVYRQFYFQIKSNLSIIFLNSLLNFVMLSKAFPTLGSQNKINYVYFSLGIIFYIKIISLFGFCFWYKEWDGDPILLFTNG